MARLGDRDGDGGRAQGMWIGLTCFGVLADKKGRRIVYLLSMLCILVFGLGSAFCGSFEALLVMRLLVGVGVGGACLRPWSVDTAMRSRR